MFRRTSRVLIPQNRVGGIECATCHFDSLPHGFDRVNAEKKKVNPNMCMDCHTKDRSPKYDEKIYMPKVSHGLMKDNASDISEKPANQ